MVPTECSSPPSYVTSLLSRGLLQPTLRRWVSWRLLGIKGDVGKGGSWRGGGRRWNTLHVVKEKLPACTHFFDSCNLGLCTMCYIKELYRTLSSKHKSVGVFTHKYTKAVPKIVITQRVIALKNFFFVLSSLGDWRKCNFKANVGAL